MSIYDKERALPNDRALLQRFMVYARVRPAGLEPAALCSGGRSPNRQTLDIMTYRPLVALMLKLVGAKEIIRNTYGKN